MQFADGLTTTQLAEKATMWQAELALPQSCRMHLRAAKPQNVSQLVAEVEMFFASRGTTWDETAARFKGSYGNYADRRWRQGTYQPTRESTAKPPLFKEISRRENTQGEPTDEQAPSRGGRFANHTCFRCGKQGHISPYCSLKPPKVDRIHIEKGRRFIATATVGNCKGPVVLDSGAEVSVLSPALEITLVRRWKLLDLEGDSGHHSPK